MATHSPNPPVVVLGGQTIALSVARSLGTADVPVHVLGDPAWDTVRGSRFCTSFVDVGSGRAAEERCLDWLESTSVEGAVVIPCTDDSVSLVARHRPRLIELGYRPIELEPDVALAMLDKGRQYDLARQVGVDTPHAVTVRTAEDAAAAGDAIGFPCALKPLHSHLFARHFSARAKLWVVHDHEELERTLAEMVALGLEMLVTEIVPGPDEGHTSYYGYLDENGESLLHFTKRKLRQRPPQFGLGTYHVSEWSEETAEAGLRFLKGVGLRGIAAVEFKRDPRDGKLKLMECNHRLTLATELLRISGIDVARLIYNRLLGREVPRADGFRDGVRLWLPLDDLRALRAYRRSGEWTTGRWVRSVFHRQHFPVLRLDDPQPALLEYARIARSALRRR